MTEKNTKPPFYLIDTSADFYRPLGVRLAICKSERAWFLAHRPRRRSAAMTRSWSHPAWQRTSTLLPYASRMERLGVRSL